MKKIMIFYGSYGGGHLSAARSIKEYIEQNFDGIEIQMVDCIEYANKLINKISTKTYSEIAKKVPWAWGYIYKRSEKGSLAVISSTSNKLMSLKLNKLLIDFKPDLIISTHPFSSQMCAFLKKKKKLNCRLATVMTDYAPHEQWLLYPELVDYFFVAHEGMKNALIDKNIPADKVYATGIPLSNRFLMNYNKKEILDYFNLSPDKKTILFFAGGEFGLGKSTTYDILQTFAQNFDDIQIVAIAGRNEKMKKSFDEIARSSNKQDSIKVLEYTDKVPELMSISDLVITKPGGLTTTESLASGLPIIIINPIPGQEEENAEFLEKNNVAIWLRKGDNVKEVLEKILTDNSLVNKMKINARLLAKRNSTKDICNILLK